MINGSLEVVGINSMTSLGEQGISFTLPINLVCDRDGIAATIDTTPSDCPPLQLMQDKVTPAILERQKSDTKPGSSSLYQSEINSYKATLDKIENDLKDEAERINARGRELQSQLAADPANMTLREKIQSQIDELNKGLAEIPKKKAEAQLRYIKQCISVLERQRANPEFVSLASQIAGQISDLQAKQKALEVALGR